MNNKQISSYTVVLEESQFDSLLRILKEKEWKIENAPYARWKASSKDINIVAYNSGKLVVQGRGTENFVLFLLEPEILKKATLGYEHVFPGGEEGFEPHIGIDESGKGDFFGPLVVAAAYVDDNSRSSLAKLGVRDSKLIKNDAVIAKMAAGIKTAVQGKFAIVAIGPESYNRLYGKIRNLNRLLAWGHSRALENLLEKDISCKMAISDQFGDERLIKNALLEKGKSIELIQRTKAESDIAVAAASILARAEFVRRLDLLSRETNKLLPKGAGDKVLQAAADIIRESGMEKIQSVAKTHFKTFNIAVEKAKNS